jgi:DNA-directed RNA polymerase specialized sigma24 family protein
MTDDTELLCQYADNRSEAAFAELVSRHVDLVYSASLRQCRGDHHRAQEVTQMVFSDLARKASALARHPVLPAWLHRSSHLAALDLLRREGRRHRYERAAGILH